MAGVECYEEVMKKTNGKLVDLHLHTTFSDGKSTPQELIDLAISAKLTAIAITDHDTTEAIPVANEYAKDKEIEIIPGIELSTSYQKKDVHILGYFIDPTHPELAEIVKQCKDERWNRAKRIVEKLNQQNVKIEFGRVLELSGSGTVARPHIARALLEKGYVFELDEAFSRYIGYHCPAYVEKFTLSPQMAFDLIHQAGGIAVWAHPGTLRRDDWIRQFSNEGLQGIEAFHPKHSYRLSRHYLVMARHLGLMVTGGTDFHGNSDTEPGLGSISVSYDVVTDMKIMSGWQK